MSTPRDRNLTVRLPIGLVRRLKEQSAAEGVSMNAYLEQLLVRTLNGRQNDARQMVITRLLERAKHGVYEIKRPLSREEAHQRRA